MNFINEFNFFWGNCFGREEKLKTSVKETQNITSLSKVLLRPSEEELNKRIITWLKEIDDTLQESPPSSPKTPKITSSQYCSSTDTFEIET